MISFYHKVGQNGNQLFIIITALLIAYKNELNIRIPHSKLVKFRTPVVYNHPDLIETSTNNVEHDCRMKNVNLKKGFYQNCDVYNKYRDVIKNDILLLPKLEINTKDVVIHLRLDGFNHHGYDSHVISPHWYLYILDTLTFDKLFIVMATTSGRIRKKQKCQKKSYLEYFDKYNPTIVSQDEYSDFEFIRSFDKIISSNSTFSWWAAFLSKANEIYLPPYWESKSSKLSTIGNVSKSISEHYEYVNIDTMEVVKTTFYR